MIGTSIQFGVIIHKFIDLRSVKMKNKFLNSMFAFVGLMCLTTFSSCDVFEGEKYIENLTYDGTTISWESVSNAKNYIYRIDDGAEQLISQNDGKITVQYDSKGLDFKFFVEAVIKENSDKNPSYTINFENIGQVTGLKIENGLLKWDLLDEADKYQILYNGDIVTSFVGTNSYETSPGDFKYQVRGIKTNTEITNGNNPYYSIWSEALTGSILKSVENLKYDSETFTWDRVEGATSYVIKIGNFEYETNKNEYDYVAGDEDFDISLKAIGNIEQSIYDSVWSEKKTYQYIAPIENLDVVDGKLVWSAPENAVKYKIKINGIIQDEELVENEYDALASGQSYRIQILPLGSGDFYFSHWSNEITVNILRSPVVSFSDGVIRWNQVSGAAGYSLKIEKSGGVIFTTSVGQETFVYNYPFEDSGDYLVYVKATTLGIGGIYESRWSNPYSVKRLSTPSNPLITNRPLEQNQVSISFNPVVGASGYKLFADDVEIASTTNSTTFSVDLSKMTSKAEESVVNFKITAIGGVNDRGAILDTINPLEFNVKKLATPQNLMINGNEISWDSVNNTSKYVLTIDGKRTEVTTTSYTLTDLSAGTHSIFIQAMGNGEDVITSGFSNELSVKKLATPTNLIISNGLLTWDMVPSATAYKVILGTETFNTDTNQFNLLGYESYISEGFGTQISVYAIGNVSNIIDSDVSNTKTYSKYTRPSNLKIMGDNLVWNSSSVNSINCNSYKLTIANNGISKDVNVTGTSYSLSNFEPGTYSVSVVALGDYVSTINSPSSDTFTFTKLDKITNFVKNGDTFTWDPVVGADGYEIKLSKDATWTLVKTNSYKPTFTSEGQFEVSVRAVGDGITIADSDVYSFAQNVSRLSQPVLDNSLTNSNAFKVETNGNEIIVTIKKQNYATGYKMFVGGIERNNIISEDEETIKYSYVMTTVGGTYKVQVQALGMTFNSNGVYLLDSNLSTEVSVKYQ